MQVSRSLKFIYSEKATKFCEIFTLLLIVCTVVKSKVKTLPNFVAFSEYMNFNIDFILITFLNFGTDDWFSYQFDDFVFSNIDKLTREDDLINKKGGCQLLNKGPNSRAASSNAVILTQSSQTDCHLSHHWHNLLVY